MKSIKLLFLGLASLFFTACGDSHESVVEDKIDIMTEMAEILNGVADGDDIDKAAKKLKALGEKSQKIAERIKELGDPEKEAEEAMEKKYAEKLTKAMGEIQAAMIRVGASGKGSKILEQAMDSIKME